MIRLETPIITGSSRESFQAVTLRAGMAADSNRFVRRERLLNLLNQPPEQNSASVVVGPAGSGKTTLARQWASDLNEDIQAIYVRRPTDISLESVGSPSLFGTALAALLNAMTFHSAHTTHREMRELLEDALTFSRQMPSRFVLDDLDFVRYQSLNEHLPLLREFLAEYRGERCLMIARAMSSKIMATIHEIGVVRIMPPRQLAFDEDESTAAYHHGLFGNTTLESIQSARIDNGGWLTGMLAEFGGSGGRTIGNNDFDTLVINEMLQPNSFEVQHIIIAGAQLPQISVPLWDHLFFQMGLAGWRSGYLLTQLPHIHKEQGIAFPNALRSSFQRVSALITDPKVLKNLFTVALEWYVSMDQIELAHALATSQNLEAELLQLMKPIFREHAHAENWQEIRSLSKGFSRKLIMGDSDLTFWHFHALSESGHWSEMVALHGEVSASWRESVDTLTRGREHLMRGWLANSLGRYHESLSECTEAYNTLPTEAHQERMYAAATAGITVSQIKLSDGTSEWRKRAAFELTFLPDNQWWWHSTIGPVALGYVANTGNLADAYELARSQSQSLAGQHPRLATRYLLLMALIDIERLRHDAAAAHIEAARKYVDTIVMKQYAEVVESSLLESKGEYELAWRQLNEGFYSSSSRVDLKFRSNLHMARIAINDGDVATAEVVLSSVAWPVDPWPKGFGDPHPRLLQAIIRFDSGHHDEAITLTQATVNEAEHRNDVYFQVAGHATLAHIYHLLGNHFRRDDEIRLAEMISAHSGFQRAFFVKGSDVRALATPHAALETQPITPLEQLNPASDFPTLTHRELEVLRLVASGQSNKTISSNMFISISTVKNHLANIFEKLDVSGRREAAAKARSMGIIEG